MKNIPKKIFGVTRNDAISQKNESQSKIDIQKKEIKFKITNVSLNNKATKKNIPIVDLEDNVNPGIKEGNNYIEKSENNYNDSDTATFNPNKNKNDESYPFFNNNNKESKYLSIYNKIVNIGKNMNENKTLDKDENVKNEIHLKQGEALLKEFYEKKKDISIEKLKDGIDAKINKIIAEANKKKDDAKILEEKANKMKEDAKILEIEAYKLEQDIPILEKKLRDEIDSEEKKEIKKFKEGTELSNLGDRLKTFGIEVNTDINEFINNENYNK